jgi:hypothetical protein
LTPSESRLVLSHMGMTPTTQKTATTTFPSTTTTSLPAATAILVTTVFENASPVSSTVEDAKPLEVAESLASTAAAVAAVMRETTAAAPLHETTAASFITTEEPIYVMRKGTRWIVLIYMNYGMEFQIAHKLYAVVFPASHNNNFSISIPQQQFWSPHPTAANVIPSSHNSDCNPSILKHQLCFKHPTTAIVVLASTTATLDNASHNSSCSPRVQPQL